MDKDLKEFIQQYIETAKWCEENCNHVTCYDIPTLKDIISDCKEFLDEVYELLIKEGITIDYAAQHFYLTRNRHGSDFWSNGYEELNAAAKPYGVVYYSF